MRTVLIISVRFVPIVLGLLFALVSQSSAQSSVVHFRYQPEKSDVGTVYHYVKTNIDGTHPEHISQYVATKDRLEVFKFHPKEEPAAWVFADMDWRTFSVKHLESWQTFRDGSRKLIATVDYVDEEKAVAVTVIPTGKPAEKTPIGHLPFHVYNFDFASLNLTFRHLVNLESTFVVGVADPNFKNEGPLFLYKGEVAVSYVSEESREGVVCRKYRIDGPGLENRGGFIWVNKELGHITDMEIDLPDNPAWQNFKFKLTGVEKLSPSEWEQFMKDQF